MKIYTDKPVGAAHAGIYNQNGNMAKMRSLNQSPQINGLQQNPQYRISPALTKLNPKTVIDQNQAPQVQGII